MICGNAFNFLYVQTHLRLHLPIKQATWTQEEKSVVLEVFEKQLQTDTLITGKEMQNLISSTPCLAKRTVPQMRVWLHTQKKKIIFKTIYCKNHNNIFLYLKK